MHAGVAQPVELAFLESRVLRWESPAPSSVPPRQCDQSVERHPHLEYELSHGASLLDGTFFALSDPTRRRILELLGAGPATISELAEPFGLTLNGVKSMWGCSRMQNS
jgi:hypothetical protein